MPAASAYATTYLQPGGPLPIGHRQKVAGPLYALVDQLNRGATAPNAQAAVNTKRTTKVLHAAMAASSPYQATLVSDFQAITTP